MAFPFPNLSLTLLLLATLLLPPLSTLSQHTPSPAPTAGNNFSPSPAIPYSPPSPPPSDSAPTPSRENSPAPTPLPGKSSPAPVVVPGKLVDLQSGNDDEMAGGGMSSGKKAGIAVGVIAAFCIVGIGALVYKKRKQNISRSQYSTAARRDFL